MLLCLRVRKAPDGVIHEDDWGRTVDCGELNEWKGANSEKEGFTLPALILILLKVIVKS